MAIFKSGLKDLNNVVGNVSYADSNAGFKSEVKHVLESYAGQGIDLVNGLLPIITDPTSREGFVSALTESLTESPLFTNKECARSPFYNNYGERMEQLLDNSLNSIATESAMWGYAPIVAYNPFFIKKQWIDCVFKDVLMTEIPKTTVINMAMERRFIVDQEGKQYALPECLYDDDTMKKLTEKATGYALKADPIDISIVKNLALINPTYVEGLAVNDVAGMELTPQMSIFQVVAVKKDTTTEVKIATDITMDITTHNLINGVIHYPVKDADGNVVETIDDNIIGQIDPKNGLITAMSTTGKVKKICLKGKLANRYNQRSLDVLRTVEQIQKMMPESGPRLNSAITVEDAADALALQNIDIIADNINIMGGTLAALEDGEIKMFLHDSFVAQQKGANVGIQYDEIRGGSMVVETSFNTLPYDGYNGRITEWMKDSREYFERNVAGLKMKLRSQNVMIVAVANPNVIRFLQDGINWVFSEDTQISGVKLNYNFGIYTSAQDRVHFVTSMRLNEEDGIRMIVIPLTEELITFKHYKYNVVIDRGYRNPMYTLVPNIMCTQRTLTFEVLPVQGLMHIDGREMMSPETLKRTTN